VGKRAEEVNSSRISESSPTRIAWPVLLATIRNVLDDVEAGPP
jgi:hypothetical protein